MSGAFRHSLAPNDVDIQLDQMLTHWRAEHALEASKAEAIRASILATPASGAVPSLPADWWDRYLTYLHRVLDYAQRVSVNATCLGLSAVRDTPFEAPGGPKGLGCGASIWSPFTPQQHDTRAWQAYLKWA